MDSSLCLNRNRQMHDRVLNVYASNWEYGYFIVLTTRQINIIKIGRSERIKKNQSKISGAFFALNLLLFRHLRNSIFTITTSRRHGTTVRANISLLSTPVECSLDDDTAEAVWLKSHQSRCVCGVATVYSWQIGVMRVIWLSLLWLPIGCCILLNFFFLHHCLQPLCIFCRSFFFFFALA